VTDPAQQLPDGQLTFTINEAAAALGISKSTAYECAHRGELPALRFGRRLVVTRTTLVTLLGLEQVAPTNTQANGRRRPRRTRWIRLPNGKITAGTPDWAVPHRRSSTG
jgi:excisionase family DNA binding protein